MKSEEYEEEMIYMEHEGMLKMGFQDEEYA